MGAIPDYNELLGVIWGDESYEGNPVFAGIALASNVQTNSGNPPYTLNTLLANYPQFFGPSVAATGNAVENQNTFVVTAATPNIAVGNLFNCPAIFPDGTVISSISGDGLTITLSNNALATSATAAALIYYAPPIPLVVIQLYINLANACVYYARYFDSWQICMGLFIAHYLIMWAQANQLTATSSVAQIAASGLAIGIKVSKHAGSVGVGIKVLDDLVGWGTFQLTLFGQQFASIAKVLGSGNMLLW